MAKGRIFFKTLSGVRQNDLVRLDWQLTQSADEAAMVCNAFQSAHTGVILNTTILLVNKIRKHKSIINLARLGNTSLIPKVENWIADKTINSENKPNILYVDAAGKWITDYCLYLNATKLYSQK